MEYRTLGRTGLRVSEIGLGGEWFNGLTAQESAAIVDAAQEKGINYIDIFMPQAPTRSNLGFALEGRRDQFIIQGHLCTVFEDGQYTRTRDIEKTKRSFEDLLERLHTDYIDVGMIHYVDSEEDFRTVFEGPVLAYRCMVLMISYFFLTSRSSGPEAIAQRINPKSRRPGVCVYLQIIDTPEVRFKSEMLYPEYRGLMFHSERNLYGRLPAYQLTNHTSSGKIRANTMKGEGLNIMDDGDSNASAKPPSYYCEQKRNWIGHGLCLREPRDRLCLFAFLAMIDVI